MSTLSVSAWRIDQRRWLSSSFSGFGAAEHGGRWNSRFVPVVYASEHLAMAASEKFVQLPKPLPPGLDLVQFRLHFGSLPVARIEPSSLPSDWRHEPVPPATMQMGDAWVNAGATAILAVPSVLYPEETNFVLNPRHPDFAKILVSPPEPFSFDPRMSRRHDAGQPPRET